MLKSSLIVALCVCLVVASTVEAQKRDVPKAVNGTLTSAPKSGKAPRSVNNPQSGPAQPAKVPAKAPAKAPQSGPVQPKNKAATSTSNTKPAAKKTN